jgi:hypothetical protein
MVHMTPVMAIVSSWRKWVHISGEPDTKPLVAGCIESRTTAYRAFRQTFRAARGVHAGAFESFQPWRIDRSRVGTELCDRGSYFGCPRPCASTIAPTRPQPSLPAHDDQGRRFQIERSLLCRVYAGGIADGCQRAPSSASQRRSRFKRLTIYRDIDSRQPTASIATGSPATPGSISQKREVGSASPQRHGCQVDRLRSFHPFCCSEWHPSVDGLHETEYIFTHECAHHDRAGHRDGKYTSCCSHSCSRNIPHPLHCGVHVSLSP